MAKIYYARVDEFWRKEQKHVFLLEKQCGGNVEWQDISLDSRCNWLLTNSGEDFSTLMGVAIKESRQARTVDGVVIFEKLGVGVNSSRDSVVYSFGKNSLLDNVKQFGNDYNSEVSRYQQHKEPINIDNFLSYERVKWSEGLKAKLKSRKAVEFDVNKARQVLYRPFTKSYLYYDNLLIDRPGSFDHVFPTDLAEIDNRLISFTAPGAEKPFSSLLSNRIVDYHLSSPGCGTQYLSFYTYDEDGTNRRENITDWALEQFRTRYNDPAITKWDIFHYVYAVLHHPTYRERYAANLRRELPRIPFTPDFRAFAEAGAHLAELHVNYEQQPEYPLEKIEAPNEALDWRVEKMKLGKDKTRIVYNKFLTLGGIPPETFEYRLGNRSALEWVIDQYQVSTDKRSGITNDPNRADDPEYIVRLVGQVVTVSLETIKIVKSLPDAFVVPPSGG